MNDWGQRTLGTSLLESFILVLLFAGIAAVIMGIYESRENYREQEITIKYCRAKEETIQGYKECLYRATREK